MTRKPQEESIYTLQRRLATQRPFPDPRLERDEEPAPAAKTERRRRSFAVGALFSWRARTA